MNGWGTIGTKFRCFERREVCVKSKKSKKRHQKLRGQIFGPVQRAGPASSGPAAPAQEGKLPVNFHHEQGERGGGGGGAGID